MKQELFNVTDEELATLLKRTHEGFEKEQIPYMFVGGIANQIHIARLLCDIYKDNLMGIIKSAKIKTQDYFRSTDDVDIATRLDEDADNERKELNARKRIFSVLEYIVEEGDYISPSEEHIININLERKGHVRPVFSLGVDDVIPKDKKISFNIYREPKDLKNGILKEFENRFYDIFLKGAVELGIPYSSNRNMTFKVKNREHLLATKIALGRPKDMNDALSLVRYSNLACQSLNYSAVEQILCCEDEHYHIKSEELCRRYEAFRNLEKTFK